MTDYHMYTDLAHLWPLISPPEDYAIEAGFWRDALRAELGTGRHEILELGVGGGHLLSHLTGDFQATAVDLSPQMLDNSRRLNPGVEHHLGDMRSVRLGKPFKAVLIHDAISYITTENDLLRVFETARAHLEPGGILLVCPDDYRETFSGTSVDCRLNKSAATEVGFFEFVHDPDPTDSTIEAIYTFVIRENGSVRTVTDRHTNGMFSRQTWTDLMSSSGFEIEWIPWHIPPTATERAYDGYLILGRL